MLFTQVEIKVEHELSVEWSIAVHMCCHQAIVDILETFRRFSDHQLGSL